MKRILLTALLTSLLLVTSSSQAFFGKPKYSFAYQVAQAGKINEGLSDMKEEKIREALNIDEGTPILSGTLAVGYATNVFDAPIGPNSLASAAFLLDLFKDRSKDSQYTQFLVWMPRDMAKGKKEATKILNQILIKAINKSAPEGFGFHEKQREDSYRKMLAMDMPEDCNCGVKYDLVNYEHIGKLSFRYMKPKVKKAPVFVSEGEAWFWGNRKLQFFVADYVKPGQLQKPAPGFGYDFYQRLSQNVPDWIYVYVAPAQDMPVPAIFHQGDMHLFIKPKKEIKSPSPNQES